TAKRNFTDADRIYYEALRSNTDPSRMVWLITTRAYMLMEEGRYEEAAHEFERAEKSILDSGSVSDRATLHNNLGICRYSLGNFQHAIATLKKAEPTFRDQHDRSNLRVCVNTLGLAYLDAGSLEPATRYLREAVQISEELKDQPAQADSLANLATVAIA